MMKKTGGWLVSAVVFAIAFWLARDGVTSLASSQPGLAGATRDSFIASAIKTCAEKQFAAQENASVPKPLLTQYCNCYATGMANRISHERLRTLSSLSNEEKMKEMQPVVEAAYTPCVAEIEAAMTKLKSD